MRNTIVLALILAIAVVLASTAASAQTPLIPVQGSLFDADVPVDRDVSIEFIVYADEAGATTLHQETQTVTVVDGFFTVYLGDDVVLDLSIFATNVTAFLGVNVEADGEMDLVQIGTAPSLRGRL